MFLMTDFVVLPLTAFPVREDGVFSAINVVSAVFWTCDILVNFTSGYVAESGIVMDTCKVARNYIRGFFAIDLFVVLIEWSVVASTSDDDNDSSLASYGSFMKVSKMARVVRLIRLMKVNKVMSKINEHIASESVSVMVHLAKLLFSLLLLSHIIACLFYYVSESSKNSSSHNAMELLPDDSVAFLYLTCLHWSLTQFTPASTNVNPMNTTERLYNVATVLCGLLIFSGLVSSITNSLMRLRQLGADQARQFWLLQRFLSQHNVPTMLAARITRSAHKRKDRAQNRALYRALRAL